MLLGLDIDMALKPLLKQKTDEIFLKWLSDPDTQQLLRTNLKQLLKGEPISAPSQSTLSAGSHGLSTKPNSPRLRPSSPSTPPCSPTINSPRSPRIRGQNQKSLLSRNNKVSQLNMIFVNTGTLIY